MPPRFLRDIQNYEQIVNFFLSRADIMLINCQRSLIRLDGVVQSEKHSLWPSLLNDPNDSYIFLQRVCELDLSKCSDDWHDL